MPLASSTSLASSANPVAFGLSVTFTATVSGSGSGFWDDTGVWVDAGVWVDTGAAPTGIVTFKDAGIAIGTGTLNPSGVTTFSTSSLATGSHPLTATYGGDVNYNTSTSSSLIEVVGLPSQPTPYEWSLIPAKFGEPKDRFWSQNLLEGTLGFPLPVVSPAAFTIVDDINKLVGHVIGTNSPVSFSIISGNSGGFFSIDPAGEISTTPTPAPTGTYTLGVTATNVFGSSPVATITIFLVPEYPILMGMIVM